MHGGERVLKVAVAGIALGGKPFLFAAPVCLIGLPHINAAAAKTKCLEAHGFKRHIASENDQVGPRNLFAVLLLDGPHQAPRLVKVDIVGPTIEWSKALHAGPATTAAITHAVRAGAVPSHANKERTVVAVVGGPPWLRSCHQRAQIFAHRV